MVQGVYGRTQRENNMVLKIICGTIELAQQLQALLLFQKTQVQLPAPLLGGSYPSTVPKPPIFTGTCTHVYRHTCR